MVEWTTVISSAVVASIISSFQFLSARYLGKMLDNLEKKLPNINGNNGKKGLK